MMRGPSFGPTFLYYFVGATFIALLVLSRGDSPQLELTNSQPVAIAFGLLSGLVGAFFNSHSTLELSLNQNGVSKKRLYALLAERGYEQAEQQDRVSVYARSGGMNILSGRIFVEMENETATVSGRSRDVRAIQKALAGPQN